jgi:hypothetical protein
LVAKGLQELKVLQEQLVHKVLKELLEILVLKVYRGPKV